MYALEPDHVGHQVIALPSLGKVAARENLGTGAGAGVLGEEWIHMAVLFGILEVARKRCGVIVDVAGAVGHEVLAPAVERMAVRVGEGIRDVDLKLPRPWLVAEDA